MKVGSMRTEEGGPVFIVECKYRSGKYLVVIANSYYRHAIKDQ